MADQLLGQFSSGMDRRSRRGGKNGPQQLWSLINGYIDAKKQVVPRPGLQHVADVANSSGLYGESGQLHVFYGDPETFVDPDNPLVEAHLIRYPLNDMQLSGHLADGQVGQSGAVQYTAANAQAPVVYSILSGSLPPGLTLSSSGAITGVYTIGGPYSWVVQGVDATSTTATLPDANQVGSFGYDPNLTLNRYLLVEFDDSTDYSAPDYDDSAWAQGLMPLGTNDRPDAAADGFPEHIQTAWPLDKNVWFRGTFYLISTMDLVLTIFLDDGAVVYINGAQVFSETTGDDEHYFWTETIPAADFVAGVNTVAVKARGDIFGVNNYLSFRLLPVTP